MTAAWKQPRGKSYPIDRMFAGVGRIAMSSGTDHLPTFHAINDMLTAMAGVESLRPYLMAIASKQVIPLVALHHYKRGTLATIPLGKDAKPLVAAFREFRETHVCSDSYRADLGTSLRHLERLASDRTPVADLPDVLRTAKKRMSHTPVAFHALRAHCLSFASEIAGELSPLWVGVKVVRRFTNVTTTKQKQRRGLTVAELDRVLAAVEDVTYRRGNAKQPGIITATALRAMYYTLAFTGMRPIEYWQRGTNRWEDRDTYVWVDGSKTKAAQRPTLRLAEPAPKACGEQKARALFTKATEKALREGLDLYSLRYTFQKLCEDARVIESRRRSYQGHGPRTVTDRYLKVDLPPQAPGDARLVMKWIATERAEARPNIIPISRKRPNA